MTKKDMISETPVDATRSMPVTRLRGDERRDLKPPELGLHGARQEGKRAVVHWPLLVARQRRARSIQAR